MRKKTLIQQRRPSPKASLNSPRPQIEAVAMPLTEKEMAVLKYIESYLLTSGGTAPSYQDIKSHFGFASFNSVQNYLKQLSAKGYVEIPQNQKRAITVLRPSNRVQELLLSQQKPLHCVPLLGSVAAGLPLESYNYDETVEVPPSLVRNPEQTFALRVSGLSMIDDGIHDGDIILVQKQTNASNGEIVVASISDGSTFESTVKRYYLRPKLDESLRKTFEHPEGKWVELKPANPNMTSQWYRPQQVNIQGILIGLIRKF